MRALQKLGILTLALFCLLLPVAGAAGTEGSSGAAVAIFPLQELGAGRNDANLPFTKVLGEALAEGGSEIIGLKTVIAFMGNNRIRTVGHLETFHISRARTDLGASFVLLGTISQRKEKPEPSMGLILKLVRTSDARTIWTFVGSLSTGEERRVLGIGEPRSTAELQPMLLAEIIAKWPWQRIKEEQPIGVINIASAVLEPLHVVPGVEVHSRVRLRDTWPSGQAPQIFFKADDQLYPAKLSEDGSTYEGTWVAGEKNGRFPVTLILTWPRYSRTETTLLGTYFIDASPVLFEFDLAGGTLVDGVPVFSKELVVLPRMLVRKPLSRWRLAFYFASGNMVGDMTGEGNLPESFIWSATDEFGTLLDGTYKVVVEAWDRAGNFGKVTKEVSLNRSAPWVNMIAVKDDKEVVVDLKSESKVPLAFWQMQLWTKEGKLLSQSEGKELPAKVGIVIKDSEQDQEVEGILVVQDVLGHKSRRKVQNLFPKLGEVAPSEDKEKKPEGLSESWVNEF